MSAPKHWNTLKNIVTQPPVLESNLRLMVLSPGGLATLWVLVEGESDPYFYERMFVVGNVKVIKAGMPNSIGVVHGGYHVVIELVGKMLAARSNLLVIGIIDKDWRSFIGHTENLPANIFLTDRRDLETTLLSYSRLRKALRAEVMSSMNGNFLSHFIDGKWYKKNDDWFRDVWENSVLVSRYMGIFHIMAAHFHMPRVGFKATDYWDNSNCRLRTDWRGNLLQTAIRNFGVSRCKMHCRTFRINLRYALNFRSFADVCRGHDIMSLLSKQLIDSGHFSEKWITFYLSKEINHDEIKGMRLYRSLYRWMNQHGISLLIT